MAKVRVKGHEIEAKVTKSAYDRKAIQFVNNTVEALNKLGIHRDDIEIPTNIMGNKNIPAQATWYFDGYNMHFSYSQTRRFIDNLYIIMKVIELEVKEVLEERKSEDDFIRTFSEEDDFKEARTKARETLGLNPSEEDIEIINKAYKFLAKKHHPDLGGDIEKFQEVNRAHKILKRELS